MTNVRDRFASGCCGDRLENVAAPAVPCPANWNSRQAAEDGRGPMVWVRLSVQEQAGENIETDAQSKGPHVDDRRPLLPRACNPASCRLHPPTSDAVINGSITA